MTLLVRFIIPLFFGKNNQILIKQVCNFFDGSFHTRFHFIYGIMVNRRENVVMLGWFTKESGCPFPSNMKEANNLNNCFNNEHLLYYEELKVLPYIPGTSWEVWKHEYGEFKNFMKNIEEYCTIFKEENEATDDDFKKWRLNAKAVEVFE